ncbi:MAG: long-chain fatty acid--CoA ligase [bacterium]
MSHSFSEKILQFIHTVLIVEYDDEAFDTLALQLFQYQFEKNAIYRSLCQQQGIAPDRVASWREIPAVTTSAFKAVALTCFPPQEAVVVFHTSGTTQKCAGKHYFCTLDFYRAAMLRSFAAYCIGDFGLRIADKRHSAIRNPQSAIRMLFLGPTAEHFPHSSLGYMFSEIRDEFGDEESAVFFNPQGVDVIGLQAALDKASHEHAPVFILGTALALLEVMEKFAQQGRKFQLPAGSRILDTGGYKGRRREVPRDEFQRQLVTTFGVPKEYLLNEYGMTELSSQFYASSFPGTAMRDKQLSAFRPSHFPPPWVRVAAADPKTLEILPEGEIGLLRIFDLANVDSVMAIQTEDLGHAWQDRLELLGRATGAELRGCSLLTEAIVKNS